MTDALWYFGRGTGAAALLLLSLSTALGIATSAGRPLPGLPRFAVTALHRNASLTASVFLIIHIGTLFLDPYAQLKLLDRVVPWLGEYRPFWLGLGTLAFDLIIAVVVTSLLRQRIGLRAWRAVHWFAYATWPVGLLHALGTGTDNTALWMWFVAALSVVVVAGAFVWRFVPTGVKV
ncbi:MAG: ferric reductase-like transmembrane domain-containing protein [Kibdelosporangium sp.]